MRTYNKKYKYSTNRDGELDYINERLDNIDRRLNILYIFIFISVIGLCIVFINN